MNNSIKKKRTAFNFIDVALIIIALVALSVLVFFLSSKDIVTPKGNEKVNIEYTVVISPVREEFINLVKIGDSVINTAVLENVGEVVTVTNSDYIYEGVDPATGGKVETPYPGMKTMVIKIRTEATKTEYGYTVSGCDIIIGEEMTLRVPDFTGSGVCTSVIEIENG